MICTIPVHRHRSSDSVAEAKAAKLVEQDEVDVLLGDLPPTAALKYTSNEDRGCPAEPRDGGSFNGTSRHN